MEIKFQTEKDFLQLATGLVLVVILLCVKQNISTLILAAVLLIFTLNVSLGSVILFFGKEVVFKGFLSKKNVRYINLKGVKFRSGFLGKPFIEVYLTNGKKIKGFVSVKNRSKLCALLDEFDVNWKILE